MKILRLLLAASFFVFGFLLIVGCDKVTNPTQTKTPIHIAKKLDSLTGTTWKWEKFKNAFGQIVNVVDTNYRAFFIFFKNDTSANGRAGCNDYSIHFSQQKDSLNIYYFFTEDVGCPLTGTYLHSLENGSIFFSATEDELILRPLSSYGSTELHFSRNLSKPSYHKNEIYEIDINNDKIIDFKFYYDVVFNNDSILQLKIEALGDNLSTYNGEFRKENDTINNIKHLYSGALVINDCLKFEFGWYDYWEYYYNKIYLPVKLKLSDGFHYGWICISVSRTNGNLTVHDYAYNKVPEQMIIAGKK